jgi:hypothetical protein
VTYNIIECVWKKNLVFLIAPFRTDRKMLATYKILKEECALLGLVLKRSDDVVGARPILEDITQLIYDAEFIICDLTHERPNVYYELGFAHAAGNQPLDILLIAREGTQLHFDIAGYRVRYYRNGSDLRSIVKRDLDAMIEETRGRRVLGFKIGGSAAKKVSKRKST